jgi:hypothetical protein
MHIWEILHALLAVDASTYPSPLILGKIRQVLMRSTFCDYTWVFSLAAALLFLHDIPASFFSYYGRGLYALISSDIQYHSLWHTDLGDKPGTTTILRRLLTSFMPVFRHHKPSFEMMSHLRYTHLVGCHSSLVAHLAVVYTSLVSCQSTTHSTHWHSPDRLLVRGILRCATVVVQF